MVGVSGTRHFTVTMMISLMILVLVRALPSRDLVRYFVGQANSTEELPHQKRDGLNLIYDHLAQWVGEYQNGECEELHDSVMIIGYRSAPHNVADKYNDAGTLLEIGARSEYMGPGVYLTPDLGGYHNEAEEQEAGETSCIIAADKKAFQKVEKLWISDYVPRENFPPGILTEDEIRNQEKSDLVSRSSPQDTSMDDATDDESDCGEIKLESFPDRINHYIEFNYPELHPANVIRLAMLEFIPTEGQLGGSKNPTYQIVIPFSKLNQNGGGLSIACVCGEQSSLPAVKIDPRTMWDNTKGEPDYHVAF